MSKIAGSKRYNLVLPQKLYDEVERIAEERDMTVVEVLRRFIKLGLLVADAEANPDAQLLIREGDQERQLVLV